jgi:hypothetical protein
MLVVGLPTGLQFLVWPTLAWEIPHPDTPSISTTLSQSQHSSLYSSGKQDHLNDFNRN